MDFQGKWKKFLVEVSSADAMQNLRGSAGDKIISAWAYDMLEKAKIEYEQTTSGDYHDLGTEASPEDVKYAEVQVAQYALMMPGRKTRGRYGPELKDMIADTVEELLIPRDITDNQKGAATLWVIRMLRKNPKISTGSYDNAFLFRDYVVSVEAKHILDTPQPNMPGMSSMMNTIQRNLEIFFQYTDFMGIKDLNRVKNPNQLLDIVEKAWPDIEAYQEKQRFSDATEGTEVFRDDDEWFIAAIHNKGAACEFGKGTNWCTAAPGLDYFNHYYTPEDPLFVFIPKNNPKDRYQFSYGSEQFMDRNDLDVGDEKAVELHRLLVATGAGKKYAAVGEFGDKILAKDPNITDKDAVRLLKIGDTDLIESLVDNKGVPERVLRHIYDTKSLSREQGRSGAPGNWITDKIAKNPSTPPDILSDILDFYNRKHEDSIGIDQSYSALAALGNPNMSKDLLHKILSGESDFKINHTWKIHNAVFNNPSLDDQFLSKYITPEWGRWWPEIFSHPNLGRESLNKIISHPNLINSIDHVKLGARIGKILNNSQLDSKLLMKLYKTQQDRRDEIEKLDAKQTGPSFGVSEEELDGIERILKQIENSPKFVKKENFHKKWKKKLKEQTTILGLSNKYNNLGQAINEKKVVTIFYEGDETVSRGARAIEPVVLGTHSQSGNPVVRAWQIQGASDTPDNLPGWRLFRVDRITRLKVTENTFDTPRPQYDPNDDHIASQDATAQFGAVLQERKKSRLKLAIYEQKIVKNFKQWRKFVKETKSRKEKDLQVYGALKKAAKKKEQERFGAEKEKAYAQRGKQKRSTNYSHNMHKIMYHLGWGSMRDVFDVDNSKMKVGSDAEDFQKRNEHLFLGIEDEIPENNPLKENRIIEFLGKGAYGGVFELDNGHALKFFSAGAGRDAEEEIEWYKDMRNAQFKKSPRASRRGELAVYDFGQLETSNWTVSWAEIGQVVPFKAWIRSQGGDVLKGKSYFDKVNRLLGDLARTWDEYQRWPDIEPIGKNPPDKEKSEYIKFLLGIIKEHLGLPEKSTHGYDSKMLGRILREVLEIAVAEGDKFVFDQATFDVHAGNFGMHLKDHQPVVFDK